MKQTFILLSILLSTILLRAEQLTETATERSLFERITKVEKKNEAFQMLLNMQGSYYVNVNDYGETGENAFRMGQLRLTIKGDINRFISYRFQQKLNSPNKAGALDNLPASIDFAMIKLNLSNRFALGIGRQNIDFGGFEFDANPIHVFQYSTFLEQIPAFHTGVNLRYMVTPTQELRFQITDGRIGSFEEFYGEVPSGIQSPKSPLGYVLNWNGDFFDSKIQTRWSASLFHEAKDKNWFYYAFGTKLNLNKMDIYVDFSYSDEQLDRTGLVSQIIQNDGFQSRILNTRYMTIASRLNYCWHPKWKLFVKGGYETAAVSKTATYIDNQGMEANVAQGQYRQTINYNVGIEYFPWDTNFRFFATYMGRNIQYTDQAKAFGVSDLNPQRAEIGFVYLLPVF